MEEIRLYDIDSCELYELIDYTRIELKKNNIEYKKLLDKVSQIKQKYKNLRLLLEDEIITELSNEECIKLQEIIALEMQIKNYEERQIFFLGARENYFYLQNLGLLKK